MKTRNRILSITLTLILAAGLFITTPPGSAFAADDSQGFPWGGGFYQDDEVEDGWIAASEPKGTVPPRNDEADEEEEEEAPEGGGFSAMAAGDLFSITYAGSTTNFKSLADILNSTSILPDYITGGVANEGNEREVKLLANVTVPADTTIDNKRIKFNLNGKNLVFTGQLTVSGGSYVYYDGRGKFEVNRTLTSGAGPFTGLSVEESGAYCEMTGVTVNSKIQGLPEIRGVDVSDEASAVVNGNVVVNNEGGGYTYGVYINDTSYSNSVEVNGNVTVTRRNASYGTHGVYIRGIGGKENKIYVSGNITATGGSACGVFLLASCEADVGGNITASGEGYTNAINASHDCVATVGGNVTANSSIGAGIEAYNRSKVTVEGKITVPAGKTYVDLWASDDSPGMAQGEGREFINKPGYLAYSTFPPPAEDPGDPGASTVWVKGQPTCEVIATGARYIEAGNAISSIDTGGTAQNVIKLLANSTYPDNYSIANKKITFNLDGKNLIFADGLAVSLSSNIDYRGPGKFEVNRTVTTNGTSVEYHALHVQTGAACRVTGVSIDDKGTGVDRQANAVYCAGNGARAVVDGAVTAICSGAGTIHGVFVSAANSIATINGSVTATGIGAGTTYGVQGYNGGSVIVNGNIQTGGNGIIYGAHTSGTGSRVTVSGNIKANGTGSGGIAYTRGLYAEAGEAIVTGDIEASGAGNAAVIGVYANTFVKVTGNVKATGNGEEDPPDNYETCGVIASVGSRVIVNGNTTAIGKNTGEVNGLRTNMGGAITAGGNVNASSENADAVVRGVYAAESSGNGGKVTVNGTITVPAGKTYVRINNNDWPAGLDHGSKPGYITYTNNEGSPVVVSATTVWVKKADNMQAVCSIGSMLYYFLPDALEAAANGETIKLLRSFTQTYDRALFTEINGKTVWLDLNGKRADLINENTSATAGGITVSGGGQLLLADPYNGEFNIISERNAISVKGASKVEVTNVTTMSSEELYAISAQGDSASSPCEVIVYGDVTKMAGSGYGVYVGRGTVSVKGNVSHLGTEIEPSALAGGVRSLEDSTIYVDGEIKVPNGARYLYCLTTPLSQYPIHGYYSEDVPGYYEYKLGTASVHVKDHTAVCSILEGTTVLHFTSISDAIGGAIYAVPNYRSSGTPNEANARTIKLLKDITYPADMTISNKKITFDLNGKNLIFSELLHIDQGSYVDYTGSGKFEVNRTVPATSSDLYVYALVVYDPGTYCSIKGVSVTDQRTDNIDTIGVDTDGSAVVVSGGVTVNRSGGGTTTGVHMINSSVVTVNGYITVNVSGGGTAYGVDISSSSEITVNGNITAGGTGDVYGAYALYQGKGTVNGKISVPAGKTYIFAAGEKLPEDGREHSSKPGYLAYSNVASPGDPSVPTASTVWVRDGGDGRPVCSIGSKLYYDFEDAVADVPPYNANPANARTIRLLRNVTHQKPVIIDNQNITLDLNGYVLDVYIPGTVTSGHGLTVENGGEIKLLDPTNGAFNITAEQVCAVYVYIACKAEVSSVVTRTNTASEYAVFARADSSGGLNTEVKVFGDVKSLGAPTSNGYAVHAMNGASITIYGDVVSVSTASSYYGVSASGSFDGAGSNVTVHGLVTIGPGSRYINVYEPKAKDENDPTSSKPEYFQYSGSRGTVWIRDPAAAYVPVSEIVGVPAGIVAGVPCTLSGTVLPALATNKGIVWSVADDGGSGAAVSGNVLTAKRGTKADPIVVRATIADGKVVSGSLEPYEQDFEIWAEDPTLSLISVSPTHAILKNTENSAVFTAELTPAIASPENYKKIEWSVSDAAAAKVVTLNGGGQAAVYAVALPPGGQTVRVTATYESVHIATATVELLPNPGNPDAKLLETAAVVNRAKEVGALVPVLITNQPAINFGMGAFSVGTTPATEPEAVGSVVVTGVNLFTMDSKTRQWDVPAAGYSARLYGYDDRYIAIEADATAKNATVAVEFELAEGGSVRPKETLKLTLTTKYPKIVLKAGELNLAFPGRGAELMATSAEGACTITSVAPAKADTYRWDGSELRLAGMTKAGTVKATVEMAVEGYKIPYAKAPAVNVKVVNTLPKVKLSAAAVNLLPDGTGNEAARISLITSDKKVPFESGYKVAGVGLSSVDAKGKAVVNSDVDVSYFGGVISVVPRAGCKSGKALLRVTFEGSSLAVWLSLKVTMLSDITKVSVMPRLKAATVNPKHQSGTLLTDVPIVLNAANYADYDWKVLDITVNGKKTPFAGLPAEAIGVEAGRNSVSLRVKDAAKLEALIAGNGGKSYKFALNIGSDNIYSRDKQGNAVTKTFAFTVTVAAADSGFSVGLKNRIDIANPASAVTATVKLSNTTSEIDMVVLYNSAGKLAPRYVSPDFGAVNISGNTFDIKAMHGEVVPGVRQNLSAEIRLKNGEVLRTWAEVKNNDGSFKEYKDRPLAVTPAQTVGRAVQSTKAATLYRFAPQTGQTVGLGLTTPANVKLGAVRLNQGTLNGFKLVTGNSTIGNLTESDGFRLEQSGSGSWTIYFSEDIAPKALDRNKTPVNCAGSYTLRLELWAEGTYAMAGGKPVPLGAVDPKGNFVAKTKPTIVSVKVNVR